MPGSTKYRALTTMQSIDDDAEILYNELLSNPDFEQDEPETIALKPVNWRRNKTANRRAFEKFCEEFGNTPILKNTFMTNTNIFYKYMKFMYDSYPEDDVDEEFDSEEDVDEEFDSEEDVEEEFDPEGYVEEEFDPEGHASYYDEDGDPFDPDNGANWDGDQQIGFRD
jgi:hypothetical protein